MYLELICKKVVTTKVVEAGLELNAKSWDYAVKIGGSIVWPARVDA